MAVNATELLCPVFIVVLVAYPFLTRGDRWVACSDRKAGEQHNPRASLVLVASFLVAGQSPVAPWLRRCAAGCRSLQSRLAKSLKSPAVSFVGPDS